MNLSSLQLKCLFVAILLGTITGCQGGASIVVHASIPKPLLTPIPIDMAIFYDESLRDVEFTQKTAEHGTYTIMLGSSQVSVFETLFNSMFRSTRVAQDSEQTPKGAVAVLAVKMEEIQIQVPGQTTGDNFEVWFKYSLDITENGNLVYTWPVTAYGKASKASSSLSATDKSEILEEAVGIAMRDVAAYIAVYFGKEPDIRKWLDTIEI